MNQDNNSFVDSILNTQKQAVDTLVENTKKFANGNTMVTDTMHKGSEWYKNWLDNQKNVFTNTTAKATEATENVKENTAKATDFFQNWMSTQMNAAKQMWDMNTNFAKNNMPNMNGGTDTNPMNQWNNMMNNYTTWMNNMNQGHNAMNQFQQWQNQMQNMFNMDSLKNSGNTWTNMFNQYGDMMKNSFADMQKNFQNGTVQDSYRNMVNVAEGFTRFSEMWAPMWKSIQEKTFNMDMYKQYMDPASYKELMDKYFGFMPENVRTHMHNMSDMMNNNMKQMAQGNMSGMHQMRDMMGNMMPTGSDMFGGMLNNYNSFYSTMSNAAAPLTKMMTPNQHTKSMMEWSDIANRVMVYNIKNAEMKYMIYNQGTKVMDQVAESINHKVQTGEEVKSMMAVYQEWLNISDKVYVSLFESDEYSKLMGEVSAMQLTLRKDIEGQLEKMMVGIPVATRSEMDEMYKTIYDLKKQVRDLEKSLISNIEKNVETLDEEKMTPPVATTTAAPAATGKTTKK